MIKLTRYVVAAVFAFTMVASLSSQAHAAAQGINCQVKDVIYDGRLFIDCTNTAERFVVYPTINCNGAVINQSLDSIKIFQSFAMAGLLAGKTVPITFENNCPAAPTPTAGPVYNVGLNNQ